MENVLVPYQSLTRLEGSRALVFAPHPDDEVFGCGGAICAHVANGDLVRVIIVTDGGGVEETADRANYVQRRRAESLSSAKVLGYSDVQFWDERDRSLRYCEDLVRRLQQAIHTYEADLVYAPSVYEMHPDHRILAMSVLEAVRRSAHAPRVALYEVGVPLPPNALLDITAWAKTKSIAMGCFASQNRVQHYGSQIEALNHFRTYTLPMSVTAAEAYLLVDGQSLVDDPLRIYRSEWERQRELGLEMDASGQPLVSVILYSSDFPRRALDSVALQTYGRIEIIGLHLGDERAQTWPKALGHARHELRVIRPEIGTAYADSINLGLDAAEGQYVVLLHDDDWLEPDHVAKLVVALKHAPDRLVAFTGVRCANARNGSALKVPEHHCDLDGLLTHIDLPSHAVMFSRELIQRGCRMDAALVGHEVRDFWIQLAQHGSFFRVSGTSAVLGEDRLETSNTGSSIVPDVAQRWRVYRKWLGVISESQFKNFFCTLGCPSSTVIGPSGVPDVVCTDANSDSTSTATRAFHMVDPPSHDRDTLLLQALLKSQDDCIRLVGELHAARMQLAAVLDSSSWLITQPLRMVKRVWTRLLRTKYQD